MDLGGLGATVGAICGDRLLGGDDCEQAHLEFFDGDVWLVDVDHQLTREDGTGRSLRRVEEDDWRRLDVHVHGCRALGFHFGAALPRLDGMMMLVMLVAVENVHDERLLGFVGLFFCGRSLVGIDWGEERLWVRFDGVQPG